MEEELGWSRLVYVFGYVDDENRVTDESYLRLFVGFIYVMELKSCRMFMKFNGLIKRFVM